MFKQIIALTLLAVAAYAQVTGWTDCVGNEFATVHELRINGTGGAGSTNCAAVPCSFVQGNTYSIALDSTGNSSSTSLPFSIVATIFGLPVTLTEGNACEQFAVGTCPTIPGQAFTFTYDYTVPADMPPIPASVRSEVRNQANQLITCVEIPVQFVTSS